MTLPLVTLAYLALPLAVFLATWLRWPVGVPLVVLLVAVVHAAGRRIGTTDGSDSDVRRQWRWALAIALGWVLLCGVGPFGPQTGDWEKHNAILKALVLEAWPVTYPDAPPPPEPGRAALVYYLGYYLPAAVVGKVLGWTSAYVFLFAWTVLGVFLALLWSSRVIRIDAPIAAMAIFVFASGLDVIGAAIAGRSFVLDWPVLEMWAGGFEYSSHTQMLRWAPQHGLVGWLATASVIDAARRGTLPSIAGAVVVTALFWSPFVAVGVLPFIAYGCMSRPRSVLGAWRSWVPCVAIALVLLSFYASLAQWPPRAFIDWTFVRLYWRRYLLFELLEVLVYVGFCVWILRRERESLSLLALASACLLAFPIYRAGLFNDFVMRTSIPSLFVVRMLVARSLTAARAPRARLLLWLVFAVGSVTPVTAFSRAIWQFRVEIPRPAAIAEVPVVHRNVSRAIARQYLGDRASFFFRALARRETSPRPTP